MIIHVPFPNMALCAHVFADRELHEHMYGTIILLKMMFDPDQGKIIDANWIGSYRAWKHYPRALLQYHNTLVLEWDRRGYAPVFEQLRHPDQAYEMGLPEDVVKIGRTFVPPTWMAWSKLNANHRGSLGIRGRYYRELWNEPTPIGILWPGDRPSPGQYLIGRGLTALVIELHKWDMEVLIRGEIKRINYGFVEKRQWVPDRLPVHERYALEYPE